VKDSGRPAPSRLVSSSDSGDMAGVVMVPFPSLTKRGSSDSAICSLESCSSPDLQASGREARQQKQKGRAEEAARRTSNGVRGRSAARITRALERAKASRDLRHRSGRKRRNARASFYECTVNSASRRRVSSFSQKGKAVEVVFVD